MFCSHFLRGKFQGVHYLAFGVLRKKNVACNVKCYQRFLVPFALMKNYLVGFCQNFSQSDCEDKSSITIIIFVKI